ncbi:MAG TPA: carbohydrate kinase family protein [Roseiarcus sp.]|nr:carbohydrate kinase family protein [Roseiarcus sp.]
MSGARFFAFGNVTIDDLVFADGSTMWRIPGGNSIYSALGMAVWGERPEVVAPMGPDYPAAKLKERIDLSRCRTITRTLRNWGLYEEDGTRQFTFRSGMRNWLDFSPGVGDLGEGPYAFCHLAPLPWSRHLDLASALRARSVQLVSIDLDDRKLAEIPHSEVARLMGLVDLFMPSRQDVAEIFPGRTPIDALKALRGLSPGTPVIIVKCGAAGAIAHEKNAADYLASPAATERAVDETGAGDAFCGGALVGFSRERNLREALTRAAVSASYAVEGVGSSALLSASLKDAEARLRRVAARIEARPL